MGCLILNLITNKQGEIKNFLNKYYQTNTYISETTFRWSMYCRKPIDCISILYSLVDNYDDYLIEAVITINKVRSIKITNENIDMFIKFLYGIKNNPLI